MFQQEIEITYKLKKYKRITAITIMLILTIMLAIMLATTTS